MPDSMTPGGPIQSWLLEAAGCGASDLHLVGGYPPVLRLHGRLVEHAGDRLNNEQLSGWLHELMPDPLKDRFLQRLDADFALELNRDGSRRRFRANYFIAGDQTGACFRVIPNEIPDFEWAGFPRPLAERIADFRNGLVIFCGVTGAGKTTTLAMIIRLLCSRGNYRIVTVEEPIEYVYPPTIGSVVTQREVGRDVAGFDEGLVSALRQDPDVILVGEIRDRDTAQTALRAAETGHLVFATLHTADAKGAVSRYTDLFPKEAQHGIRSQLATNVRAIVSQHLLAPADDDDKRVLTLEVMFNNSPIGVAIRTGKLESIDNTIQTARSEGMVPLDESIRQHLRAGRISRQTAERYISDPAYLRGSGF